MSDEEDFDALVRRVDPDRWLSVRFVADPAARADLLTLYAFDHELARASAVTSTPLLAEISRVFVPLMQQNLAACERCKGQGETLFNEPAFDAGRALYDGEIDGYAFRHVAKTFQAKVWRQRVSEWRALPEVARHRVELSAIHAALRG